MIAVMTILTSALLWGSAIAIPSLILQPWQTVIAKFKE